MTEEPAATGQRTGSSRPRIVQTAKASDQSHVFQAGQDILLTPESAALVAATAIFGKAFLEALGQRAGDGVANIPRQVHDLVSARKRRKGKTEVHLGTGSDVAAKIAIAADTPDEARLALLDLDVTAEDLRGKLLRWDDSAAAWRPVDDQ